MNLNKISALPPEDLIKDEIKKLTKEYCKEIGELQVKLYAQKKYAILVILQGMDSSGKSGTVRDVFEYVNPMGINVQSFKKPTSEEFAHDFLWRVHKHTPKKGMMTVFDRSHYEDILIQRVHNWIDENRVQQRMKHINNFEQLLIEENNTVILKFFLHISYEEQYKELKERISEPEKRWKHNDGDWEERKHWSEYMNAYEDVFKHCSERVPWTIVPANKGWYKRYIVAKTILEKMRTLDLKFPEIEIDSSIAKGK